MANKIPKDSICVFSFNSRGFSDDKQDICRLLFTEAKTYYPVICNQENFLLKGNMYKINQCLPNARILMKPAIKSSEDGRPKNGMFIAIHKDIGTYVEDVSPTHWRIQAVLLTTPGNRLLIINSYFPTDPRINNFDSAELLNTLIALDNVLADNDYNGVLWVGDINSDFERKTAFTKLIDTFIQEKSLQRAWEKYPIDFTHSCERDNITYVSTLDHCFWSEGMSHRVVSAGVLHLVSNMSDH